MRGQYAQNALLKLRPRSKKSPMCAAKWYLRGFSKLQEKSSLQPRRAMNYPGFSTKMENINAKTDHPSRAESSILISVSGFKGSKRFWEKTVSLSRLRRGKLRRS